VEQKLNSTIERLEKELAEEQAARLEAQKIAEDARLKSDDEIRKLKESLEKAQKENEEFKRLAQGSRCAIL
jgi:predicted translin family RNA/ssDNA-binding protein